MKNNNDFSNFLQTLTNSRVAFIALIAVGGYFLWTEHQAHLLAVLPFAIFLLCPLMHIFGHGRHDGDDKGDETHNHRNH
jgi:hypothetical protein